MKRRRTARTWTRLVSVAATSAGVVMTGTPLAIAAQTPDALQVPALPAAAISGVVQGFLPPGAIQQQLTQAPADGVELSTGPRCAETMFIGVPGTFETNRDTDPNTPVGLLAKVVEPLEATLGGALSATYINYDADAAVNGTSYLRSVEGGVKKSIATIQDAAARCPDARFLLSGFSQGAEVAGDVATAIGQRRTSVDPGRVMGVALFSDPKRSNNSNVLVDTAQTTPSLPELLQRAVDGLLRDPSFAQMQMQLTDGFTTLANQVSSGLQAAGSAANALSGLAGQAAAGAAAGRAGATAQSTATTPSAPAPTSTVEPPRVDADGPVANDGHAISDILENAGRVYVSTGQPTPLAPTSRATKPAEGAGEASTSRPMAGVEAGAAGAAGAAGEAGAAGATTTPEEAGATAKPSTTTAPSPTRSTPTPSATAANPATRDGGLSTNYARSLAGQQSAPAAVDENARVAVPEITLRAVSGGGISGQRDTDFGELKGVVAEICVPGDIACSLPEDSAMAQSLIQFGKNVSANFPEMRTSEGATRMAGLIGVQAVNTVADITGLPRTKLSGDTLVALVKLVVGGVMLGLGDPAGAVMVADCIQQLPQALPEVFAQLQDIPAIVAGLPNAVDTAARNLGLDKVKVQLDSAFAKAGLTDPTQIQNLPAAIPQILQALLEDNQGLLEIATNPTFYNTPAKHGAFDTLQVSGQVNAFDWVNNWFVKVSPA